MLSWRLGDVQLVSVDLKGHGRAPAPPALLEKTQLEVRSLAGDLGVSTNGGAQHGGFIREKPTNII